MEGLLHTHPLPAYDIPHTAEQCGNPEWCLHEEPTERAEVRFQLTEIPSATKPWVTFQTEVATFEDRLKVDTEQVTQFLQQNLGWTAVEAAFQLQFCGPQELRRQELPDFITGIHFRGGTTRRMSDGENELLYYRHNIVIPLVAEHLTIAGIARLNNTFRHELAHAICSGRFGEERLYHRLLDGEDQGRYKTKALGFIPVRTVVKIAEALGLNGFIALHRLDKEERFCNKFARKQAKVLNPISLRYD